MILLESIIVSLCYLIVQLEPTMSLVSLVCNNTESCLKNEICKLDQRSNETRCLKITSIGNKCSNDEQCQLIDNMTNCHNDTNNNYSYCRCSTQFKVDNQTRKYIIYTFSYKLM